jgi:ankyrin repeat protein
MIVVSTACGKKTSIDQEDKSQKYFDPSTAEVYFHALQEIKRSIAENDLPALKKTAFENPGLDLNQMLDDGDTFLIKAILKDFRDIRNFFIDKGVSIEKPTINQQTPLMIAAAYQKLNSVQVLLDLKVDIKKKDANGDNALHLAIKNNDDEIALMLIKHGAKVEALDSNGRTAFKLAEQHKVPQSYELMRSILDLEFGAPDLENYRNILVHADHISLSSLLSRHPKIAIDHAYESINPLVILVDAKDQNAALKSAELLIKNKANIDGPQEAAITPLIRATITQKKALAQLYLASRANPQLLDAEGKSALIHAVELNNPEMVDLLLNYSAVEKYSFRKDGKKISYNACTVARSIEKNLTTVDQKNANKKIKDSLSCGIFGWSF